MNNDKKGPVPIFEIPGDSRQKAVWLRRWIESLFNVYGSITIQAAKAMPDRNFNKMETEATAVKAELLKLINPEKWESENESGKN